MPRDPELAEVLGRFVERSGYSAGRLGRLSGIPKRTIANWLGGRVRRPRHAGDLLKLAQALRLNERETNELLGAAKHPSLPELRATAEDDALRDLLAQTMARDRERAPFQAVPDLPYFVGRKEEVQALREALLDGGRTLICSLQGMAGVGKTALAAHVAYRLRPHFPDGVLWARVDKAEPMSILSAFANAYGRDVTSYADVDSRSQVVREILAGKQALIVLDNARHSEEIQPLLPPSVSSCAVIITTRHQNLAVTSGIPRFTVGPFEKSGAEAIELFARFLGEERVQQEKSALGEIADLLGHLPLAVAIAASRMAYEPGWSAPQFLEHLQQKRKRLDLLRYDDQSVRLSARVTYDMLQPQEQAFFAALGAFSPENVNVEAIAAVTDREPDAAEATLRQLYSLSLVQVGQGERYRLHPLLHDFARERFRLRQERGFVLGRMVNFYADYLDGHRHNYDGLERELDNLLAAVEVARDEEMHEGMIHIVTGLHAFLETKGMYDLAADHLEQAEEAARTLGDAVGLAGVLLNRARLSRKQDAFTAARASAEEGLKLARESEDKPLTSALLGELGVVLSCLGQRAEVPAYYQEGLDLARELGDPDLMITHLTYQGLFHHSDGGQAETYYKEALALARQIGDTTKRAKLSNNLGDIALDRGELSRAEAYFRESLSLGQELGYRELLGIAHVNLGEVARLREEYEETQAHLEEALAIARRLDQKRLLRLTVEQLGELAFAQEQYKDAEAYYREALSVAREGGERLAVGNILLLLARVLRQRGAEAEVETYFHECLVEISGGTNYNGQASLLNEWGDLLLQGGNSGAASTAYAEAKTLARKGHNETLLEQAKKGLDSSKQETT